MMDLGQVEAFVQVATLRSFSRAGEALRLTQPSITARIQALERDVGEPLFERDGRGVRLTEAGNSFLPYARRVLKALVEGREALEGLRSLDVGHLRLGAAATVGTYVLPGIVKSFCGTYPRLDVSVRTGFSEQIVQMVTNDEVRLGLVRRVVRPEIATHKLYEEDVVLVTAAGHPFSNHEIENLQALATEPFIMYRSQSSFRQLVDSTLRDAGIAPRIAMELDSMEATKQMIEQGLGIAMLPRVSVEREVAQNQLALATVKGLKLPHRDICLIYRRHRKLTRAALAFVDLLAERFHVEIPITEDQGT